MEENSAAAALYEYACLTNDIGEQVSEKLEKQIKKAPESIDYDKFFYGAFYNVSYTDYLFSLPIGAGKTYLMATFIYLDLYYAGMKPRNSAFAHNFIIFAPSGLKSSVVPSLKTIQKFNPAWIILEPAASDIKRKMIFEVLDQSKTTNKSNKTKNPNVQKIANHQPLSELFGLVADKLAVGSAEISNVVYYYPLIDGVGNFLKKPTVKISDVADSAAIIEVDVKEFLDNYKDTVYEGGLTAKLGIYCGSIEKCEELVYPLVSRILSEYGLTSETAFIYLNETTREYI